jgi:hypothetical protein
MSSSIIAGFYCSSEEAAAYTDDKIIIRAIFIVVFIGFAYLIVNKIKRTWLRNILLILLAIVSLAGYMFINIMIIPWGC